MSDADGDIDALLGDVKLDGEEAAKPDEAPKDDAKSDEKPKSKRTSSDEAKADRAAEMDEKLKEALEKHLANPELAVFMVDLLSPGTAAVNLDFNLTPGQHALIAFGGVAVAALATNPEVVAKLRNGFGRKTKGKQPPAKDQKKLPAKADDKAPPANPKPPEATA